MRHALICFVSKITGYMRIGVHIWKYEHICMFIRRYVDLEFGLFLPQLVTFEGHCTDLLWVLALHFKIWKICCDKCSPLEKALKLFHFTLHDIFTNSSANVCFFANELQWMEFSESPFHILYWSWKCKSIYVMIWHL